ncbi:MAG: hypothetical protein GY714_23685 [Desulfobacterales bacterium]|nr:hypothetical protein [Desulfobacterales bacterium]MCP4160333.1 hypothetical protein [Deltaproteobacteria bacterium]
MIFKKQYLYLILVIFSMLSFISCQALYVPLKKEMPFNINSNSKADVEEAIRKSFIARGWAFKKKKGENFAAILNVRKHEIKVNISYTEDNIIFKYVSSKNMNFGINPFAEINPTANTKTKYIHKNYQMWVDSLFASINSNLSLSAN